MLDPQIAPKYGVYLNPNLSFDGSPFLVKPGTNRTMADGIKHPRVKQAILGFDHELFPGFAVGVTGIWRDNDHFIEDVLTNGTFTTSVVKDPGPDGVTGTADDNDVTVATFNASAFKTALDALALTFQSSPTGFPQYAEKTDFVDSSNDPVVISSDYEKPVQNNVTVTVTYSWLPELYLVGPIMLKGSSTLPVSY